MPDKYLDTAQRLSSVGTFQHCIRKVAHQNSKVMSINIPEQMENGSVSKHNSGCKKFFINFDRTSHHNMLLTSLLWAVTCCNS